MAYDTAQVCLNGHVVNPTVATRPDRNERFCSKCGSSTIMACIKCQAAIRGMYRGARGSYVPDRAAYCYQCGNPYPWTEAALQAASDLVEESELSAEDRTALRATFPDLVSDSPQTTVAVSRFKRIIAKAGPAAADGFKTILVNVVTETAKKLLFPGP